VSKVVDKSKKLSAEDAKYLSDRGQLSAEEQAEYGIVPNPLGGTPPGEPPANTGDVGSSDDNALVGPATAPSPEAVAEAAAVVSEEPKPVAKKAAKASKAPAKASKAPAKKAK
jgi:hypothetical protein